MTFCQSFSTLFYKSIVLKIYLNKLGNNYFYDKKTMHMGRKR